MQLTPTRNFTPPAATGSNASGRDRMPGTRPGGILYELLRVTTHPRAMRRPWSPKAAWEFVTALLASPGLAVLVPTDRHADVADEVILEFSHLSGNLFHDAHTAIVMREHGIRQICTPGYRFQPIHPLESHRSASTLAAHDEASAGIQ
jgi:predicted nucleic acid-binding protein